MIPVYLLHSLVASNAALSAPAPVPLFLKAGYSSVLEFEEAPARVVIGDAGSFQVERMEKSILVRPVVEEASTNLVVYFKVSGPRMFILKATPDEEPAMYRKYVSVKEAPAASISSKKKLSTGPVHSEIRPAKKMTRVTRATLDQKGDYLIVEASFAAPAITRMSPQWKQSKISYKGKDQKPSKIWAEREVVQPGATIRAKFVFNSPEVPKSLAGVTLSVPVQGKYQAIELKLRAN